MTEDQIKFLQSTGGEALAETEKNILGNHIARLWEIVKEMREQKTKMVNGHKEGIKTPGGQIDFVLDNAGFELYCDCVYGESQRGFSFETLINNSFLQPTSSCKWALHRKSVSMASTTRGLSPMLP